MDGIENYNEIKQLSKDELEELVPSWFEFKLKPWKHQLAAIVASISEPGFLNCMDMGTGKTAVAINVCRYMRHFKRNLKVLVICLNSAVENWADEVAIHSNMKATTLRGTMDERWQKLDGDGFFIVNFEGFIRMIAPLSPDGHGKHKMRINLRLMAKMKSNGFDVIIVDESHKIKNSKSLTYRAIRDVSKGVGKRMLLTGTPFGNSLIDVWSQYYLVDFGETFGNNFCKFRNAYFVDKGFFGPLWKITPSGKKYIESKLYSKAIRYREDEVDELPEKVYRTIKFELTDEQRRRYDFEYENSKGDISLSAKKTVAFRQICSGFVKEENDHKNFPKNPKLNVLEDLIVNTVDSNKIVIFHEFIKEGEMIEKLLKKLKIKYNKLNGRVKDKHKEYKTFAENDKYRVMVAHPKSGGSSINLIAASYCIFYSNGNSVIERKQCEKRIHRGGQTKRCFYYDILATGTVEMAMYSKLIKGKEVFTKVVDNNAYRNFMYGEE